MIRQHFLQQQRLNNNHDRLLERYNRLTTPQVSQFQTFGTSSLPGRNYDHHLSTIGGNSRRRDSLVAQSRANIGPSSETYRWLGDVAPETLPRNIASVMQHSRQQPIPLVHAEKFEPVQVYEHPIFGPVPAYIRPVYNERSHQQEIDDDDDEEDAEVRSHTSLKIDHKVERTNTPSTTVKDDVEESNHVPKGYISYKNWKAKYENLIPVNPLLFNIYTQRSNGSINSYGQSLYTSPNHLRQPSREENVFTPTSSDAASVSSEIPRQTSTSSFQRYNRLQPQSLPPIRAGIENESSDDEASPPESPIPYLSRNRPNPVISTPLSTAVPTTPIIPRSVPITTTFNTSTIDNRDSSLPPLTTTSTSTIPPAPPMPSSLLPTSSNITYQTPSSLPIPSTVPATLSTTSSAAPYQIPSTIFPPSASSLSGSTAKAVTFGGSTSVPVPINDISSSSDSDDDGKKKRRRQRKKQAAASGGVISDSSSSDD